MKSLHIKFKVLYLYSVDSFQLTLSSPFDVVLISTFCGMFQPLMGVPYIYLCICQKDGYIVLRKLHKNVYVTQIGDKFQLKYEYKH